MRKTLRTIAAAVLAALNGYSGAVLAAHAPQGPIELMRGLTLRGPIRTKATSGPNQWSGNSTINSGTATLTISTQIVNSDSIIALNVQAALPAAYTTQGFVTVAAGAATATASTTAVYSGYPNLISFQSTTNQASGQGRNFKVDSIVDRTSFAIVTEDGQNVTSGSNIVWWKIPRAEPAGIKVNTISSKNYFTIGWADQQARPVDTTIMWEIRRTS